MSKHAGRQLDLEALTALAHPLRVRIFDALSLFGPATASGLGERLGESSGATSYHLRQLARYDLVREVEGRGTGRERWWERTPGGVGINAFEESEAARAATKMVLDAWSAEREHRLADFLNAGPEILSTPWMEASVVNTANVQATADDLMEFNEKVLDLVDEFVESHRDRTVPGSRPIQIQFNSFVVIGGEEVPQGDPS